MNVLNILRENFGNINPSYLLSTFVGCSFFAPPYIIIFVLQTSSNTPGKSVKYFLCIKVVFYFDFLIDDFGI